MPGGDRWSAGEKRMLMSKISNLFIAIASCLMLAGVQAEGKGFSLIEVISSCPTNWGMTPQKALEWVDEKMIPYYPLGVYKDKYAEEAGK